MYSPKLIAAFEQRQVMPCEMSATALTARDSVTASNPHAYGHVEDDPSAHEKYGTEDDNSSGSSGDPIPSSTIPNEQPSGPSSQRSSLPTANTTSSDGPQGSLPQGNQQLRGPTMPAGSSVLPNPTPDRTQKDVLFMSVNAHDKQSIARAIELGVDDVTSFRKLQNEYHRMSQKWFRPKHITGVKFYRV